MPIFDPTGCAAYQLWCDWHAVLARQFWSAPGNSTSRDEQFPIAASRLWLEEGDAGTVNVEGAFLPSFMYPISRRGEVISAF